MADSRLIIDAPAAGAWNMAVDEALLIDAAENGIATLRFYEWSEPTLSLGYFQAYDDRRMHSASRACACVRRQTGGGAIVHDRELTYSIVLPPDHALAHRSSELYAAVHDAFIQTLVDLNHGATATTTIRRLGEVSNSESSPKPFLCFERRGKDDVVTTRQRDSTDDLRVPGNRGNKILGSAQRRSRGSLLQHGSLLLRRSAAAPELDGFYDIAGINAASIKLESLIKCLEMALDLRFVAGGYSRNVELNAQQLANNKYGRAEWTKRR